MGAPSAKGKQKQVTTSATELGRAGAACLTRWRRCVISADGGRPHPASRTSPGGRGDAGGSLYTRLSPRRGESVSGANRWRAPSPRFADLSRRERRRRGESLHASLP